MVFAEMSEGKRASGRGSRVWRYVNTFVMLSSVLPFNTPSGKQYMHPVVFAKWDRTVLRILYSRFNIWKTYLRPYRYPQPNVLGIRALRERQLAGCDEGRVWSEFHQSEYGTKHKHGFVLHDGSIFSQSSLRTNRPPLRTEKNATQAKEAVDERNWRIRRVKRSGRGAWARPPGAWTLFQWQDGKRAGKIIGS